jgi:DNA ligase-1
MAFGNCCQTNVVLLAPRPESVVELEFDEIRLNKRTKANYVLWKPRLKTFCWDLNHDETNTLKDVEEMLQNKLDRKRLEQNRNPSFYFRGELK